MIKLFHPFNLLLDEINEGEVVIVEYNTAANVDLLPFQFLEFEDSVLIVMGDRLSLKLLSLLKVLKEKIEIRGSIILISNNPIEFEGFEISTIKPVTLNTVLSEIYGFIKDRGLDDGVVVIWGTEQMGLYVDLSDAIKEFAKLKSSMPGMTVVEFINFEAVDEKDLAIIESAATTIFRLEGKLSERGIERRIAILKSINPIKKEVAEFEPWNLGLR